LRQTTNSKATNLAVFYFIEFPFVLLFFEKKLFANGHNFCCCLGMETFGEVIKNTQPVLVDFHATWCGPCKMMAPELQKFAQKNTGKVRVIKIDIDKNPAVAQQFRIQGVPTLILFKEGKVLWRQSGAMSSGQISDAVSSHL
jgi:thioredoxin 1